jgi:hypothetical protein
MNRRVVTLVPIVLGGAAGALFGLVEAFPSSRPATTSAVSAQAPSVAAALGEPLPSPSSALPSSSSSVPPSEAAAAPGGSAALSQGAPLASAALPSASNEPLPKRAFDLSEPTTGEALLAAQVQCNSSSAEDCERAALALESGSLGVKDPPRAKSLRRIALTRYVKQCETGRALACARLAEMYDAGDIVQANPRNAQALRARVTELCQKRPGEAGCSR